LHGFRIYSLAFTAALAGTLTRGLSGDTGLLAGAGGRCTLHGFRIYSLAFTAAFTRTFAGRLPGDTGLLAGTGGRCALHGFRIYRFAFTAALTGTLAGRLSGDTRLLAGLDTGFLGNRLFAVLSAAAGDGLSGHGGGNASEAGYKAHETDVREGFFDFLFVHHFYPLTLCG
jgi:hypothetical protein